MPEIGQNLSHYSLAEKIGKGGMGEVFRAKDQKLGRDVAIKVLPEEFARDTDRLARFEREAKLLASLNHPNIAAIHGLEESDGTHFLVLELVEGDTLADRIKAGPIPVEESLKLALQIAEALEAAHEKGVIHRDLKPSNIKVTPDGKVKVLDFGLAKAYAGNQEDMILSDSPTISAAATQKGVILGTAAYMSPEQAKGKTVDKKTDIWAFGCVLYEMLTGKAAFQGDEVSEILASVIKGDTNLDLLPANIHPRVHELLSRCLQKDLKDRYRDIGDALFEIKRVLADPSGVFVPSVPVVEPRRKLRTALPWTAAIILAVIIAGVAVWYLRTPEPPEVTRFYYELPEGQQFFNLTGRVLAVSPDGKQFVYSTTEGLYLRSIGELDAKLIAGTTNENILLPFFSPDGKWIGYFSLADNKLKKIAIGGGAPVVLCDAGTIPGGASWHSDNSIVYSAQTPSGMDIMRISSNGGTPETLIKAESEILIYPQLLPDGNSVLFTKINLQQQPVTAQIMVQSLKSGERKELFAGYVARYLPTGHIAYIVGDDILGLGGHNLFAVPFDFDKLEVTGGAVSLVEDIRGPVGAQYAISDSGTLVYLPGATGELVTGRTLVWVDRDGKEESIAAPPHNYLFPNISPDGTRAVLTIYSDANSRDIWIWSFVRNTLTRLTFDEASGIPTWTPDGKRIAFSSTRDGVQGTYWKAADGTGKEEKLCSEPDKTIFPWCFSSDGKNLVMSVIEGAPTIQNNKWDIGILSMEGEHVLKPLLHEEYIEATPQVSPDGRWIAYSSSESTGEALKDEVYVRPFPDVDKGKWQVSTNGGGCPRWSPDGRELLYLSHDNSVMAVAVQTDPTFSLGTPKELFKSIYAGIGASSGIPYDISPDGKRFLMIKLPGTVSEADSAKAPRKINVVLNWFEELKERVPAE